MQARRNFLSFLSARVPAARGLLVLFLALPAGVPAYGQSNDPDSTERVLVVGERFFPAK